MSGLPGRQIRPSELCLDTALTEILRLEGVIQGSDEEGLRSLSSRFGMYGTCKTDLRKTPG